MPIYTLNRVVARVFGKVSLRTVLIVAFVLQIVGAVGLVGYLSFRHGQQAVNEVSSQLRREISDRIEQNLRTYLATPFQILQANQDVVTQGMLRMENLEPWELYLWRQGKLYNHTSVIGVGNEQGNYQAVEKLDDGGQLAINVSDKSTGYSFRTYATNSQGKRTKLIRDQKNFDLRLRPWYKAAVIAGKPTWSEIYPNIDSQTLNIAAVQPVYSVNSRLEGVLLVTQRLFRLGEYLRSLKIGKTGKAFIIERSGMVVATSSAEVPFRKNGDQVERLKASDSSDTLTQATAKYLSTHFLHLKQIQRSQQLEFKVDGKRQFLQVLPFQDGKGLDWLIVVVMPEADFMEQINPNIHTTILLCVAALIGSTGIGILTTRWITKPILRLNTAAKEIAQGEWDKTVEIERSDEVGQLAKTFNQMAAQLQESFAALQESESRLTQFLEAVPVGVTVHDATGKPTYANQTAKQIMGIDTLPDSRTEQLSEDYQVYLSGTQQLYPVEKLPMVRALSGESSTVDDMELHRPDRPVPLEVWATPIYNRAGQVVYAITAFTDITERKQAQNILADYNRTLENQVAERTAELININEQLKCEIFERQAVELALKQKTEILQTIFDNIPVMLSFYNASVEVEFINQAFESTLGWSLEEIREIDIMAQCYPDLDHRVEVLEFMMRAEGTWKDFQLRTRAGNILFTSWANVCLPDGSRVGIGKDITERKQAEAELLRSKDLLESIFNESADAIFLVNAETLLITDCNRRAVELFEAQSKDELININGNTFQKESFTPEELQSIVNEITLKGFWTREIEYVSKKGKRFWGNLAVKQIYVAGQKMDLVRVTDITTRKQAEEALRESQRFIERIADASTHLWYIYDHVEQRNVYANREMAAVLGYTPEELQTMGSALLPSIVHPDDLATFPEHFKKWETATDDDVLAIEYRLRNAKGEWRTLLTRETVFERTPDGKVKQVIGTSTDISDRKQIEEVLRESALRERAIAYVLQRMRQTLDIHTIFSATTEELRQVLNCDRVAIYRFNPDWSGEFVAESVAKGWVPLIIEQKNDPQLTEDAVEDSNCTIKTVGIENNSVRDTYLQDVEGGAYSQGVSYRVTEDIYKAGFTPCYINLLERFQVRAYLIVPIFCGSKLWGLLATYQNSSPRSWSEAQISAVVQIGAQLGIALQQAQLLQQTQQQAKALELALEELKRTQAQLIQTEKMSSLGRMVAGIAHEINNPVSFIYGNLAPARQYFQDLLNLIQLYQQTYPHSTSEIQQLESEIEVDFIVEDWQKLIDSMQVGAERIRKIVLSLRNFSRLDEKELKAVNIHEGIDNTLLILQHRLKAKDNAGEIEVIKHYGQLPRVTCYASQLNQVFMNLLSNAIDALETQASSRIITITTSSSQKSVGAYGNRPVLCQEEVASSPIFAWVVIRIADNGTGMSEAVKKKIFDPFFTTKPIGRGAGLGLSTSYQIVVEKHKGQILCTSAPGQGTEFIVEMPVNQGHTS